MIGKGVVEMAQVTGHSSSTASPCRRRTIRPATSTASSAPTSSQLGDGYLIHGTRTRRCSDRPASHGCVRVGLADLERLYSTVPNGTKVYIFE